MRAAGAVRMLARMNRVIRWQQEAIAWLEAERRRASPTPLRELALPARSGQRLVFKDESVHPSGSLKHRLARALFLHHLHAARIAPGMAVYDASSGSTAVSEAWFAGQLGLKYFAVIPAGTSPAKLALIRAFGGETVTVAPGACCKREAARLAAENNGCFLDQFGNAARVVDWRAENVIVELFMQLANAGRAQPDAFVCGAGTGGTAACAGRFFRHARRRTRLLVVDPEDSAFFAHFANGATPACLCASRIEGIGRPAVEPAFDPRLVHGMMRVPDAASFAAARWLQRRFGWAIGPSTGTNFIGAVQALQQLPAGASVATLICDGAQRYADTLDNPAWLADQGFDCASWEAALDHWHARGEWLPPASVHSSMPRNMANSRSASSALKSL